MTTPTGYLVNTGTAANPVYKDLIYVFEPYTSGAQAPATGYQTSTRQDLSKYFAKRNGATPLPYSTGLYALSGQDLTSIFLPASPYLSITAPAGNYYYYYTTSDGYTVYIFANYTSQTTTPPASPTTNIGYNSVTGITVSFNNFVNNPVYVTAVGGGGGGGNGITYSGGSTFQPTKTSRGGGGGGGGGVGTSTFNSITGQLYTINVGGGGVAQQVGSSSSMGSTATPIPVVVSSGGNPGTDGTQSAPGTGGAGGAGSNGTSILNVGCQGGNGGTYKTSKTNPFPSGTQGTDGTDSALFPINPNTSYSYYFGGGGGGGYAALPYPVGTIPYTAGGLGGGGSTNAGTNGNEGLPYSGPNSIYYAVGGVLKNGYPGVGGGGSGGNASSGDQTGGQGGSGVVILCYKTVNP